jgi:hypothetical protein
MFGFVLYVRKFRWYVSDFNYLNVQINPVERQYLFAAVCGGMSKVVFY